MSLAPYIAIALSYLLGAVPFGFVTARLRGVDIFAAGSGNIGATNVGRVLGRKFGLLVFVLDFLKGAAPTGFVRAYLPDEPWAAVAAGLAAFVGHMFPVYLRFRGGKGVATGTGVVAVLMPGPTAVAAFVWAATLTATRYVSLSSILAALSLAAFRLLTTPEPFGGGQRTLTGFALLAALLVIARHRSNLARLRRGQENRVADSPKLIMLSRVLHVLAMGLWFGAGVFFTFVVALSLLHTFEELANHPTDWLPPVTGEQGTRLFGLAIGPIFSFYFAVQGACGLVAVITAWGWTRTHPGRVHGIRFGVIAVGLLLVLAGWAMLGPIEELRAARYLPVASEAEAARSAFSVWHTISLFVNFGAVLLAGIGLALAARLPADPRAAGPKVG